MGTPDDIVNFFNQVLSSWGFALTTSGTMIIILILLVIFHLEKLEYFASKVLSLFQWTGTSVRKQVIARDIRARILQVSKEVSNEVDEILPYDMKIEWVKEMNVETFLKKNQVIVRMNNKSNKTKNIVYAINEYVAKGLIPKTRKYIDGKVIISTDLIITRRLLFSCYESSIDYFDEVYLKPMYEEDEEIKDYIKKLLVIENSGILVQVLLKEFIEQGRKVYPGIVDPCLIVESKNFVKFLYNIAAKPPGEIVDLTFTGEYFRVGVILVAKIETLHHGLTPYINRALRSLDNGTQTLYLLADSSHKANLATEVARLVKSRDIRVKSTKEYKYKRKIC